MGYEFDDRAGTLDQDGLNLDFLSEAFKDSFPSSYLFTPISDSYSPLLTPTPTLTSIFVLTLTTPSSPLPTLTPTVTPTLLPTPDRIPRSRGRRTRKEEC